MFGVGHGLDRAPRTAAVLAGTFAYDRGVSSPYSSSIDVYDFLFGNPAFPWLKRAFDQGIRRFGLEFGSIADVGCGTGRFLAELAHLPIRRVGIDSSAAMLAVARRRLAGHPVLLLRQDVRRLSLPSHVDLITCNNQTINYLTKSEDIAGAFRAIARNLRSGGTFIFDFIASIASLMPSRPARIHETIRLPDHDVEFDGTVDPRHNISVVNIRLKTTRAPHRRALEVHRQRWFSPSAILRLLRDSGFRVLSMRPVDGSGPSAWLHVIAKRL